MKNKYLSKILVLLVTLFCFAGQAMAGNDYYAKVTANVDPSGAGTVYVDNGSSDNWGATSSEGGGYSGTKGNNGGTATIKIDAKANAGYKFNGWTFTKGSGSFANENSTNTTVTVKVSNNKGQSNATAYTIKASFIAVPTFYFSATAAVSTAGGGTASVSPTGTISDYGDDATSTSATTKVTFTATPSAGYYFSHWSNNTNGGTSVSEANPYEATITSTSKNSGSPTNTTLYAVFKPLPVFYFAAEALVSTNSTGGGTASVSPTTANVAGDNKNSTSAKTNVTYTATPATGWRFVGWSTTNNATTFESTSASYSKSITSTSTTSGSPTKTTMYANFEKAPTFYLQAVAEADPHVGGTVTAKIDNNTAQSSTDGVATANASKDGDFNTHYKNQTFNITYTATPAANYSFEYWHDGSGNKIDGAGATYTLSNVAATSKDESNPTVKKLYAKFSAVPTSVSAEDVIVGIGAEGQKSLVVTLLPEGSVRYLTFSIPADDEYAFVDAATGLVTGKKAGQTTVTITAYKDAAKTVTACSCTANIFVRDLCKTPVIDFTPIGDGQTATATITSETDGATIYYKVLANGGSMPDDWTEYTDPITINNLDKVYAYADKPADDMYGPSKETSKQYSTHKVATPTITVSSTGAVTFDCEDEPGVTYYYTTNGSEPTTGSSSWTKSSAAITGLSNETQVKVIAVKTGCQNSNIATKGVYYTDIVDGTVYLNDYEDHTWTYYAGVDASVDGGNYNSTYLSTSGGSSSKGYGPRMYSPDPRNVKITYKGVGLDGTLGTTVAISKTESENQMIYYETIEKVQPGEDADYAYTVIPNPFSKRPKSGSTYYGFGGWKVTKGWDKIKRENGSTATQNAVLNLDEKIHFINLDEGYTPNCTSADVEFEATWVEANVVTQSSKPTFTGGTYETNFWVVNSNPAAAVSLTQNMTMTQMTPDGGATADYTGTTITRGITFNADAGATPKMEWVKLGESTAFTAAGKNMFIGRGVTNSSSPNLQFHTGGGQTNQIVRVESGKFSALLHYTAKPSSVEKQIVTFGSDYDRAKNDNKKLQITGTCVYSNNVDVTTDNTKWGTITRIKSGEFCSPLNTPSSSTQQGEASYYYLGKETTSTKYNQGCRYLEIQGGDLMNLAGGSLSHSGDESKRTALALRMKGGTFHGIVFGCARGNNCNGSRSMILTGGRIMGWITSGANGTVENAGQMDGYSFIYVGGNSKVDSEGNTAVWCHSATGNVFGAGSGIDNSTDRISGSNTMGTNVTVADNGYVERGVYGGGSFGFCTATANIYVTGGHVAGKNGGVANATGKNTGYDSNIQGGVYGGSCQNKGGATNIYMTGGLVETGIYGGSNAYGNLSDGTNIVIVGGQVGTTSKTANVHGGGYGQNTVVNGNVDVAIGQYDAATGDTYGNAIIYGDVYGGSALGKVNGSATTTEKHTNVSLNAGTIHGSLYGGALGNASTAANVYGPVQVTVHGGSVKGEGNAIYGCNNVNGAPQSTVDVDIWNTDPAEEEGTYAIYGVFGGGNRAAYNGKPTVTVHNCDNSIEYVYGGGNAATVKGTDVLIEGGNVIGNVFGGGYGANVNGDISLDITGGSIINVFGGNNNSGEVTGTINIKVAQGEPNCTEKAQHTSGTGCPINITKLCGGGNMAASRVANIDIGCCDHIGTVYGGAEAANMNGNIDLKIKAGNISTVFGGNNQSGSISGTITVTVDWDKTTYPCESSLGTVYGGGNLAEYNATNGKTTVNILNCEMTGSVFGGGKGTRPDGTGAHIVGNTYVNIGDWKSGHDVKIGGNVFGGGDEAAVEGYSTIVIRDCDTEICGDLYGGGNAAPIYGTDITMWGGSVKGNVFGGGNGAGEGNPGANVGYNRNNTKETDATGDAVTRIYGGHIGELLADGTYKEGTGGTFGGSNSKGDIKHNVTLLIDQQTEIYPTAQKTAMTTAWGEPNSCELVLNEAYGAGNEADFHGNGITFNLGCIDVFNQVYGGAKDADLDADVHLIISSGTFNKVFGGNNKGGNLNGSIKVTIEETGCNPVIINELYGGGNMAAYEAPTSGKAKDGVTDYTGNYPEVNVISCTHIGQVFGGGYGKSAVVTGNPIVNINQIPGKFANKIDADSNGTADNDANALGSIGTVFGGGNAANVVGNTNVNIGTKTTVNLVSGSDHTGKTVKGVNISGNVYGGGNAADVTGKTNVTVGR